MQITDKDIQMFRERAKTELQSNGAVGRLAWDTIVNALCNEVEALRKNASPGNAAAMRAALEEQLRYWNAHVRTRDEEEMRKRTEAALAAPARNCDRFATLDEARKAFQEARGHKVLADVELWDSMDEAGALVRWLFAPAEGGAK